MFGCGKDSLPLNALTAGHPQIFVLSTACRLPMHSLAR